METRGHFESSEKRNEEKTDLAMLEARKKRGGGVTFSVQAYN